jgi:hypothetical protein
MLSPTIAAASAEQSTGVDQVNLAIIVELSDSLDSLASDG